MKSDQVNSDQLFLELQDVFKNYSEEEMPELKDEKVINLIPLKLLNDVYSLE